MAPKAVLIEPSTPVSDKLGKYCACAAPMLALAAISNCSA